MSLRKSPCLTPTLLASNRRNAKRSTGPRTARGKAWSRLNHLREGWRSPEYLSFVTALFNAPPGRVEATAHALLSSKLAIHPLFMEIARIGVRADMDIGNERRWRRAGRDEIEKKNSFYTFEAGMCMKTKEHKTQCPKQFGHLCLRLRQFCITDANFAEKCRI